MPNNTPSSPDSRISADELLSAADHGSGAGRSIARGAATHDGFFAIVVAALIASFLLAVEYVFPSGNLVVSYATVALYGAGIVAIVVWHQRRRRAARGGWSRRYSLGFTITIVLYAIGVALSVSKEPSSPAFWIPYAVVTAAPLVIAALWRGQK